MPIDDLVFTGAKYVNPGIDKDANVPSLTQIYTDMDDENWQTRQQATADLTAILRDYPSLIPSATDKMNNSSTSPEVSEDILSALQAVPLLGINLGSNFIDMIERSSVAMQREIDLTSAGNVKVLCFDLDPLTPTEGGITLSDQNASQMSHRFYIEPLKEGQFDIEVTITYFSFNPAFPAPAPAHYKIHLTVERVS